MTLEEVLNVTCCAVKIIHHCPSHWKIFISRDVMEFPPYKIYQARKGLIEYANYEVLSMNTYYNGVETVLTIII